MRNRQTGQYTIPLTSAREDAIERKKVEPLDYRLLDEEATATAEPFQDVVWRHREVQLKALLQDLGVDPSRPDAWKEGFIRLATDCGVGHVVINSKRTNRSAARWTRQNDLDLLREVIILGNQGLSERGAIKRIAADEKKRALFPYREQGHRAEKRNATSSELKKCGAALLGRYRKLLGEVRRRPFLERVFPDAYDSSRMRVLQFDSDSVLIYGDSTSVSALRLRHSPASKGMDQGDVAQVPSRRAP